jgi:hypothetical protein
MKRTSLARNLRFAAAFGVWLLVIGGCVDSGGLDSVERVISVDETTVCTSNKKFQSDVPCFSTEQVKKGTNSEVVVGSCLRVRRFTPTLRFRDAKLLNEESC